MTVRRQPIAEVGSGTSHQIGCRMHRRGAGWGIAQVEKVEGGPGQLAVGDEEMTYAVPMEERVLRYDDRVLHPERFEDSLLDQIVPALAADLLGQVAGQDVGGIAVGEVGSGGMELVHRGDPGDGIDDPLPVV